MSEFLQNAEKVLKELKRATRKHPEYLKYMVCRNDVGNFAFEDSDCAYFGYIDFFFGDTSIWAGEGW